MESSKKICCERSFRAEDLLSRAPLCLCDESTLDFYRDRVILVTGGGGSVGGELCRALLRCHPRLLILLDVYENNAYDLQQEMIHTHGEQLPLAVEIASVRDRQRLEQIFAHYRPRIVFHAAAHKHVPLMEHNCGEAIKNNVMGTYNTADMAEKYGAERFVLVSTDKAVNPTNIMGASKRVCEMIAASRADSATTFASVRFGNVLGSSGSVIPLFRRQIEAGGPITVTDKRIIRYFMTLSEAAALVLQAGFMARGGEIFVPDMGEPIPIVTLAENMIRMAGLEPYRDIPIKEIGLRPGEKLYEELLIAGEQLDTTGHRGVFVERDRPLTRSQIAETVAALMASVETAERLWDVTCIKQAMKQAVPTYRPPVEEIVTFY